MPRVSVGLHELPTTPHFLYRFYDRTDTLLYIGITNDPRARFKWHRKNQPWWPDVDESKTRIDYHSSREAVLEAERKAIVEENPLYNDQHNLTVDTPNNKAIADAVRHQSDVLLFHMCKSGEDYEGALRKGREAVEQAKLEDDDEFADADPVLVAAELKACNVSSEALLLGESVEILLEVLPASDVERWQQKAKAWANEYEDDDPKTEAEMLRQILRIAASEAATRYLGRLPEMEAGEWRRAAQSLLNQSATDDRIDLEAARYARSYKAKGWYSGSWQMCRAGGWHGAACPHKATIEFTYDDCPICDEKPSCVSHLESCSDHIHEISKEGQTWTKTGKPVVVAAWAEKAPVSDPWAVSA